MFLADKTLMIGSATFSNLLIALSFSLLLELTVTELKLTLVESKLISTILLLLALDTSTSFETEVYPV